MNRSGSDLWISWPTYRFFQGNDYHLANQRQRICFRREKGNCKLCYSHVSSINDVQVSGVIADKQYTKSCCSYKADGAGTNYDCLQFGDLSTVNGGPLKLNQNGTYIYHIVWKLLKMSHLNFGIFQPIFVLLKLTCLVTLFDRKLQEWTIFGIFN